MKIYKSQILALIVTLSLHGLIILLLFVVMLRTPEQFEESGVPVTMGNTDFAKGKIDSYQYTEVSKASSEMSEPSKSLENHTLEQNDEPMITQPDEETVPVKPVEKSEEAKRAEAEKRAAELAQKQMANAFGKGFEKGSKGNAEAAEEVGTQGVVESQTNAEKATGVGIHGTFDLNGRNIVGDGLPMPVNTVQDEGMVVVTVTVNPEGRVIETRINLRTNTVNAQLRKAAEDAARRARFNKVDDINNTQGTITYYFKLR